METKDIVNRRTGLGAGIGGIVGFFFAGPLGGAVGAVAGAALANAAPPSRKGMMTGKRKVIYQAAIAGKDYTPEQLRELADAFEAEGLKAWGTMLRKRAALRELPDKVRASRRDVYRKAMACDSPEEIDNVAALFEGEGSADAAKGLRDHADAVRAAHAAGKSAKPMADGKMIEAFARKLLQAIVSFGPDSDQARSAAANFVQARGLSATPESVGETIAACAAELDIEAPAAGGSSAAGPTPEDAQAPSDQAEGPPSGTATIDQGATPQAAAAPEPAE